MELRNGLGPTEIQKSSIASLQFGTNYLSQTMCFSITERESTSKKRDSALTPNLFKAIWSLLKIGLNETTFTSVLLFVI